MGKKVRSLAFYGFIGAVVLIGFSVLVLNHYWTALGINPKTQKLPQITKDYEEFKDYTTLLLALISAAGTLLSSLLIILFYDAWKEQKIYDLEKEYADKIIHIIYKINIRFNKLYYSYIELSGLDKNIVYLNKKTTPTDFNLSENLYELETAFKTLQKLTDNYIDEKIYKNFEDLTLILNESFNRLDRYYNEYYKILEKTQKPLEDKIKLIDLKKSFLHANYILKCDQLKKAYNKEYTIEINHNYKGVYQPFTNTFSGFKSDFDIKFSEFNDKLIEIIKP
jgi:hypothetical protein